MAIIFMMLAPLAIKLALFLFIILIWIFAFIDFAIIALLGYMWLHGLGWHTVFILLTVIAALGAWFGILQIPYLGKMISLAVVIYFCFFEFPAIVNGFRAYDMDTIWTIFVSCIAAMIFGGLRFMVTEGIREAISQHF